MGYGIGGVIEAQDFNALVDGGATGTLNGFPALNINPGLNALWNDGTAPINPNLSPAPGRSYGYGEPVHIQVLVNAPILATTLPVEWQAFYRSLFDTALHQNTTIQLTEGPSPSGNSRHVNIPPNILTGGTMPPTVDKIITWEDNMVTMMSTLAANRLNCHAQGSTSPLAGVNPPANGTYDSATGKLTSSVPWVNKITMTFDIQFASDEAIRYFFNAGGQLLQSYYHPPDTGGAPGRINDLISDICFESGTTYFSSPGTGTPSTMVVAPPDTTPLLDRTFTGVKQIKPTGALVPPTVLNTGNGFYTLDATGTDSVLLVQKGDAYTAYYYTQSNLTLSAHYLGNGLLRLTTVIDEIAGLNPPGYIGSLYATAGTESILQIRYPSTTYLPTAAWGIPTITATSIIPG